MATLSERRRANGTAYVIYFYDERKRLAISLSQKYSRRHAEETKYLVETLGFLKESGERPDRRTTDSIDRLPTPLRKRLVDVGLLDRAASATLETLWTDFLQSYPTEKRLTERTLSGYESSRSQFFLHFYEEGDARSVTQYEAVEWLESLADEFSEATIATRLKHARTVWKWGMKRGYVSENPFSGISGWSYENKEREHCISRDDYRQLLAACPDQTWRTLLAFCRIGGLRNPSETLRVKWSDVNWETGKMLVHSPKTKRYAGKDTRVVPMFPEMREELEKQFEQAEPGGSPFVIDRWRDTSKNMRTRFQQIIFLAGLGEWPRLFHNLRGSRSNELFSQFPAHVAAAWMGQSPKVAARHYLHPTEEQFAVASGLHPDGAFSKTCAKTCAVLAEPRGI